MKKIFTLFTVLFLAFATSLETNAAPFQVKPPAHTKRDGTPDKRFKENKAKPPVHTKRDGTPDKRFKENKVKPPVHTKRDGTPDKRFKENKKKKK
jgi:hypothetical protein